MVTNVPLYNSIICYIITIIGLYIFKPSLVYDNYHNEFKEFGCDENETIFTIPVLSLTVSVIIYIISATLSLLKSKSSMKYINSSINRNKKKVWKVVM